MRIEETLIPGLKLIHLNKFEDLRGGFIKVFNSDFFDSNRIHADLRECYFSISHCNVIRGMHFQLPAFAHTKLVYINKGRILDVVLDIRKASATFGQHFSIQLNADEPILIYIPVGCAHGFLSLEDGSMVSYMQSTVYSKDHDCGIRYDSFGMNWNVDAPVISERDKSFESFTGFKSPF
jgi:dTDP-4-dehydrorhamnose 3,5-epimerase/CDP-3, 6-dideoxy-D-glycero-D-glycero-4-hexulose-5-epimerase